MCDSASGNQGETKFYSIHEGDDGDFEEVTTDSKVEDLCRDVLAGGRLLVIDGDWEERDSEYDQDESQNEYDDVADGNDGKAEVVNHEASTSVAGATKLSKSVTRAEDKDKGLVFHPEDMNNPPLKCGLTFSSREEWHNRRKCPSRTVSQVTQNEPADEVEHNVEKTHMLVKRKLIDETSIQEDVIERSILQGGKTLKTDKLKKNENMSVSQPLVIMESVHITKEISKAKQKILSQSINDNIKGKQILSQPEKIPKTVRKTKENSKGNEPQQSQKRAASDEPNVMILGNLPVPQVKTLRGRTINVPAHDQATKKKKKGKLSANCGYKLIDEPIGEPNADTQLLADTKKDFQGRANAESNMAKQLENLKEPNGKIHWGSNRTTDYITEQTAIVVARGNEFYAKYGFKLPSSAADGMFTSGSNQVKIDAEMTANLIALTNDLHDIFKDLGKANTSRCNL
ncbi:OLC1v1036799C1 [Oldenlandia corymbosa var. corymbosa]|uniref:OLC1v1036799C1 n=1 Tax=Oldenlandia corymbosa var. corymbosa TaxID=529605 RepID=A0AAV1CWT1_OLDCO|nr:OLC1v1036799C1 [Oldenlandia corymbosa var. corymbosa]